MHKSTNQELLIRMFNISIHYLQKLGIQSIASNTFMAFNDETIQFDAMHPFLKIDKGNMLHDQNNVIQIIQARNSTINSPVHFGEEIILSFSDNHFLSCNSKGEVFNHVQEYNWNCRWIFIDPENSNSNRVITFKDQILLKSSNGKFFNLGYFLGQDKNGQCLAKVNDINASLQLRLVPEQYPFTPNWMIPHKNQPQKRAINKDLQLLGKYSAPIQETFLLEDILYIFQNFDGLYLKKHYTNEHEYSYVIEPHLEKSSCGIQSQLDLALYHQVNKILELVYFKDKIISFTQLYSTFEAGFVGQVLAQVNQQIQSIKVLLRDFTYFVNEMDALLQTDNLTLPKLWFYLQNPLKILELIARICDDCNNLKGGMILDKLYTITNEQIDHQKIYVCNYLLNNTCIPWMKQLQNYMYEGIIDDHFQEFFILQQKYNHQNNTNFLENSFKIIYNQVNLQSQIPVFVQQYANTILLTGKYINLIKEFNPNLETQKDPIYDQQINLYQYNFQQCIQQSFQFANQHITQIVLHELKLIQVLKSMKRYFFLENGDFLAYFMDKSESHLMLQSKDIQIDKIQSLLEVSLQSSSAVNDLFKDNLFVEIENYSLQDIINNSNTQTNAQNKKKLNGIQALNLFYKVQWPLDLIISQKTFQQYQIVFRYLFQLKFAERSLLQSWKVIQSIEKKLKSCSFILPLKNLINRIIQVIKNTIYYFSYEIIEQKSEQMMNEISQIKNFEEIVYHHEKFINSVINTCLLKNSQVLENIISITSLSNNINILTQDISQKIDSNIYNFSNQFQSKDKKPKQQNQQQQAEKQYKEKLIEQIILKYKENIDQIQATFDSILTQLFQNLIERQLIKFSKFDQSIIMLLQLFDYDGFYQSYLSMNPIISQQGY